MSLRWNVRRRAAAASWLCALVLFASQPSLAQGVPALPPGPAVLTGVVESSSGPAAQVNVVLYALSSQGHPGLGQTVTDAAGRFRFENLSNDPAIAYLLGARYAEVPFSRRVAFTAGQTELDLRVEVTDPVGDTSPVQVTSTQLRIDWAGSQLAVRTTQVLNNPTQDILFVGESKRASAKPLRVAALPAAASDFARLPGGGGNELERIGNDVAYWGPFFPGEQELTYQYLLPATPGAFSLGTSFPSGSGSLAVAYATTGPEVRAEGLTPGSELELDGIAYQSLAGSVGAGSPLTLEMSLPEMRSEVGALTFTRTDLFLELDDASLVINQDITLDVAPGAPLVAPPGELLMRLELPVGAQLTGMSNDAATMGVTTSGSTILLAGPLKPGSNQIGFRYAIAVQGDSVDLDLRFPITVETLRLHIADTGDLVLSSNRLHRLRPERSGTRAYLQREAFHVEPGQRVGLTIARPIKTTVPRTAAIGLMAIVGLLACLFLIRPLQQNTQEIREADNASTISHKRSLVYASIHDLDHDFETGKVLEADYETMRAELRQSAIDLLRTERQPDAPVQDIRPAEVAASAPIGAVPTAAFCPACGGRVDPAWLFCSHCGGGLSPQQSADSGSSG